MNENLFNEALREFIAKPSSTAAFALLTSCKVMIIRLAKGWRDPNLSLDERIREIMSEILLILLEDFSTTKVKHPNAVLSFIQMKIRRLTKPYVGLSVPFGNANDMSELGRVNFSALRLELADEIFRVVRRCLLNSADQKLGLLEFLFIHVYPEITWASKMLAQNNGIDLITQINADKKRHSRFNLALRNELKKLNSGDFFEVSNWSGGERSHMAWRIINITPTEIADHEDDALQKLEQWRETIDRRQPQPIDKLLIAQRIYNSMRRSFAADNNMAIAAEEAEPYGEEPDLILQLLGGNRHHNVMAHETNDEWQQTEPAVIDSVSEAAFSQVASQVMQWFDKLISDKQASNLPKKNKNQW